jgi:hypothetical protein
MARKDTRNLVLEVDPGVGKTRTALHQAAKYGHQRKILYSAPNHELAEESYHRFCELPGHPDAHYMYGRNKKNCPEFNRVKEAVRQRAAYFTSRLWVFRGRGSAQTPCRAGRPQAKPQGCGLAQAQTQAEISKRPGLQRDITHYKKRLHTAYVQHVREGICHA